MSEHSAPVRSVLRDPAPRVNADFTPDELEDIAHALRHYWHFQVQTGAEDTAARLDALILKVDSMEGSANA